MLITSGLGGIFPPNYPVATVTKVERTSGEPFATIEAKPLAQLDKSREVLLVWRNVPEVIETTIEEKDTDNNETENNEAVEKQTAEKENLEQETETDPKSDDSE